MADSSESHIIQRAVALIIDSLILGVVVGVLGFLSAMLLMTGSGMAEAMSALLAPVFGILTLAYFIVLEARDGQTLGKKAMDIRVEKQDGSEMDYLASTIRNVLRAVDGIFLYLVGLVVILITEHNQRVGDIAAGTVVKKA